MCACMFVCVLACVCKSPALVLQLSGCLGIAKEVMCGKGKVREYGSGSIKLHKDNGGK